MEAEKFLVKPPVAFNKYRLPDGRIFEYRHKCHPRYDFVFGLIDGKDVYISSKDLVESELIIQSDF
jgi:hypothetical protein